MKGDQNTGELSVQGPRVLCGDGINGRVRLWNWKTGKVLGELPRSKISIRHVDLHPNKRTGVVCYGLHHQIEEHLCELWDLMRAKKKTSFHVGNTFSQGVIAMASACGDGSAEQDSKSL